MDLLPTIGTAIQKLQGTECNAHLQTVNVLKMVPTLLQFGPIPTMNTFLAFYQTHHSLDDIPNPTIRIMEDEYPTVEERTKAMHFHTTSLQQSENLGIQTYVKCLESILTIPTTSYNKQVEENKHLLNLKKLSNEIIMGGATEDTAMEFHGEGAVNFEQLKDLIRNECDKRDRRYAHLEDQYKKLEHQVSNQDQQKKAWQRGADNQQATDQAPRRKTNPTKGKPRTNEAIAQEAFPQTTQVKQTEEDPKTQDEPSKTTTVQGQKTKTNLHCPHKTNQIGINAMLLAGKNHHRSNNEKLNIAIRFHH